MMANADAARDGGNLYQAAALYELAALRFPNFAGAWVQFGNMTKDVGDFQRAEAAYRRALEIRPGDADVHLQLGHLFKRQGRINDAVRWYEASQQLDPKREDATRELAAMSRGQIMEAHGTVDLSSGAALFHQRLGMATAMRRQ